MRFLTKAIRRHGVAERITIDGSEANAEAIRHYNDTHGTAITLRQVKYLTNIIEQDHRTVKGVTRPMLGFKSVEAAHSTLAGVELMHMLRKGPLAVEAAKGLTPAQQFYALAASFLNLTTFLCHRAKIATKPYQDLGTAYFDHLEQRRVQRRLVHRLERMGYQVSLQPSVA